jgi:hypothetical protein
VSIQRYTLGMGRESLDDEDEPCLFQDENGEVVTYDDHIAEVSRVITAENARLESCRTLCEKAQGDLHKAKVERDAIAADVEGSEWRRLSEIPQ